MKPVARPVWMVGVAVALTLGVLWAVVSGSPAPRHDGRTVGEWLERLDPLPSRAVDRDEAVAALGALGAGAVPGLRAILRVRGYGWFHRTEELLVRYRILPAPALSLSERKARAAQAAWMLAEKQGVDISPLVPALRHSMVHTRPLAAHFGRALVRSGPDGVAVLIQLLGASDPRVRDHAGWALALDDASIRQPGAHEALLAVIPWEKDPRVAANWVLYLSKFRGVGDGPHQVALGLRFLESTNVMDRWAGAELLGAHAGVPEARSALEALAADPELKVRSAATRGLAGVAPGRP